jgi:hypothetical protein
MTAQAHAVAQRAPATTAVVTPARASLLQRKCACGASAGFSGECEECGKKRIGVQRRIAGPANGIAPPIVHEVLRAPGAPLDAATRAFMEPRFGHDFSRVRVHTDAHAAQSADAVNAFAYTVDRDVVFASGRYAPHTGEGRKLLAHELVHTLQQPESVAAGSLRVDAADSPLERAADRIAEAAMRGHSIASPASGGGGMVQRRPTPGQLEPTETLASKEGKPENKAGHKLEPSDTNAIEAKVTTGLPAATTLATPKATTFVLHDSASEPAKDKVKTYLDNVENAERGPLNKGVNAYVPREGDPRQVRPLFTQQRPGAVTSEQELQYFAKPDENNQVNIDPTNQDNIDRAKWSEWRKQRDALLRTVWNAATKTAQNTALGNVLPVTGEGKLSEQEKYDQLHGTGSFAKKQKETKEPKNPQEKKEPEGQQKPDDYTTGALPQLSAGATELVMTTGLWAVENLCSQGVDAAQYSEKPKTIDKRAVFNNACDKLKPYFAQRNERIGSTVHVEMLQQKEDKDMPKYKEMPKNEDKDAPDRPPAYTADQYENVVGLYLRTAQIAGHFPNITTHFFLDGKLGGHRDPRCFDLDRLYREIAATIRHPAGCTYGVKPSYGTEWGKHNIWWTESDCHCKPPGAEQ